MRCRATPTTRAACTGVLLANSIPSTVTWGSGGRSPFEGTVSGEHFVHTHAAPYERCGRPDGTSLRAPSIPRSRVSGMRSLAMLRLIQSIGGKKCDKDFAQNVTPRQRLPYRLFTTDQIPYEKTFVCARVVSA